MKIRLCHIDTEAIPEIGLEAEKPKFGIKLLPKQDYGCHVVMIHLWYYVIEISTGEGI